MTDREIALACYVSELIEQGMEEGLAILAGMYYEADSYNRFGSPPPCGREYTSLDELFIWDETPEGFDYWAEVFKTLRPVFG